MNLVILKGRLSKDPDVRESVTRFGIAVQREFKNNEGKYDADFLNCVAFGKTAEFISKYFQKGSQIIVTGRLQTGSYTNKDGNKINTTDVVVDKCEFCDSKSTNENKSTQEKQEIHKADQGFLNIASGIDEELPFQ